MEVLNGMGRVWFKITNNNRYVYIGETRNGIKLYITTEVNNHNLNKHMELFKEDGKSFYYICLIKHNGNTRYMPIESKDRKTPSEYFDYETTIIFNTLEVSLNKIVRKHKHLSLKSIMEIFKDVLTKDLKAIVKTVLK